MTNALHSTPPHPSPLLDLAIDLSTQLQAQTLGTMNTISIRAFIPPLTRRCLPLRSVRHYAVQSPGAPTLEIFSHQHKWMQKERAASDVETSRNVDHLRDVAAERLCERLMVCFSPLPIALY
jgi:hypothetical protein